MSVVRALPPLSLAVESKLPRVGLASLSQLTTFLAETAKPSSPADPTGEMNSERSWGMCVDAQTFHFIGTEIISFSGEIFQKKIMNILFAAIEFLQKSCQTLSLTLA